MLGCEIKEPCMRTHSYVALFLIGFALCGRADAVSITAIESFGYNSSNRERWDQLPGTTVGWVFTTTTNITVTRLGFLDVDNDMYVFNNVQDDLRSSHQVGIFDPFGNLLVSGTVNPGAPLDGIFRYTNVTPTLLAAGGTYVIGAFDLRFPQGGDLLLSGVTNLKSNPSIVFVGEAIRQFDVFGFPNDQLPGTMGEFGPNFQGDVATEGEAPEPSTFGFVAIPILGALLVCRRRLAVKFEGAGTGYETPEPRRKRRRFGVSQSPK
jgi:hypothetical protein